MNKKVNIAFLEQTARDYDMDLSEVKRIWERKHEDDFYQGLEDYLKSRQQNNE